MTNQADYLMVFVSDMARSVRFYRDVLGLALRFESPHWTEFETGSTTIALHGAAEKRAEPAALEPRAGECRIGFSVDDVEARVAALEAGGARIASRPTRSDTEGVILAVALDPDDLPITFAQSLR